jgi:hypothetical protein
MSVSGGWPDGGFVPLREVYGVKAQFHAGCVRSQNASHAATCCHAHAVMPVMRHEGRESGTHDFHMYFRDSGPSQSHG